MYLDADLPTPGRSWRETVVPALVNRSRRPAGRQAAALGPVVRLGPAEARACRPAGRDRDEAPEVPMAFLKEERPSVEWSGACGYVQLSPLYEAAAAEAPELGWPVERLESHHLAAATSPSAVAAALEVLINKL